MKSREELINEIKEQMQYLVEVDKDGWLVKARYYHTPNPRYSCIIIKRIEIPINCNWDKVRTKRLIKFWKLFRREIERIEINKLKDQEIGLSFFNKFKKRYGFWRKS